MIHVRFDELRWEHTTRYVRRITSDGTDIHHSIAEFNESTPGDVLPTSELGCERQKDRNGIPLDRNVQVGQIVEDEVDHLLILVFAEPTDERLRSQLFAHLESCQAILSECIVKVILCYSGASKVSQTVTIEALKLDEPVWPRTDSCSSIFLKSDPPTKPITTFLRTSLRTWSISAEAPYLDSSNIRGDTWRERLLLDEQG